MTSDNEVPPLEQLMRVKYRTTPLGVNVHKVRISGGNEPVAVIWEGNAANTDCHVIRIPSGEVAYHVKSNWLPELSKSGNLLAIGTLHGLDVLELRTGRLIHRFELDVRLLQARFVAGDGLLCASRNAGGGQVRIWDPYTGAVRRTLDLAEDWDDVVVLPGGKSAYAISFRYRSLYHWSFEADWCTVFGPEFGPFTLPIKGLLRQNRVLAFCGPNVPPFFFDVERKEKTWWPEPQALADLQVGPSELVAWPQINDQSRSYVAQYPRSNSDWRRYDCVPLGFSPDGRLLAGGWRDQLSLWDLSTQKALAKARVDPPVWKSAGVSLDFSRDGSLLAVVDEQLTVYRAGYQFLLDRQADALRQERERAVAEQEAESRRGSYPVQMAAIDEAYRRVLVGFEEGSILEAALVESRRVELTQQAKDLKKQAAADGIDVDLPPVLNASPSAMTRTESVSTPSQDLRSAFLAGEISEEEYRSRSARKGAPE